MKERVCVWCCYSGVLHGNNCSLGPGTGLPGNGKEGHTSKEYIPLNVNQKPTNQPTPPTSDTFFNQFSLDPFCVPNQQAPLAVAKDNPSDSSPPPLFKKPPYSQASKLSKKLGYIFLFYVRRVIALLQQVLCSSGSPAQDAGSIFINIQKNGEE